MFPSAVSQRNPAGQSLSLSQKPLERVLSRQKGLSPTRIRTTCKKRMSMFYHFKIEYSRYPGLTKNMNLMKSE